MSAELYRDLRLGGIERWVLDDPGKAFMRIPDDILQCIVFICYRDKETPEALSLAGTGFFVSVPLADTTTNSVYLVTAKHVIDGIRPNTSDHLVHMRLNRRDGTADFVVADVARFVSDPDDPFIDVAVLAFAPGPEFDYRYLPVDTFATAAILSEYGIGPGDDTFTVGLFVNHHGNDRNEPIVRVGTLASMPRDPVTVKFGETVTAIEAYLVEVRSIGGLSGCPVFVHLASRQRATLPHDVYPTYWLLGIMHGHWNVEPEGDSAVIDIGTDEREAMNMGIAIVVPIQKVMDMLNQPGFVRRRQEAREEVIRKRLPVQDSTVQDSGEPDFTRDEFEEALHRATRPVSPSAPDEASSET